MSRKQPHLQLSLMALALATAGLSSVAMAQQSQQNTQAAEKVVVTGEGDKLGSGLMVNEDASKNRSTITRAQMDKSRSSSNPFQLLELLPGVNAYSFDGTGMFGGQLKVRGFNSDQLGFTINGAPVNDSGNFAVFPQEYTDTENLCVAYVTQGSPDNDAPHVGASGGNVGLVTCKPKSTFGGKVELSGGQRNFGRVFARVDVPFSKEVRSLSLFPRARLINSKA